MKKIILYFIFIILLIFTFLGNSNWFQNSNSDLSVTGGNAFIGYASNYNGVSNASYEKCEIETSVFPVVSADFDNSGVPQIVTTQSSTIRIYDSDCAFSNAFTPNGNIRAEPILLNTDGDELIEIFVLNGSSLMGFEYNELSGSFEMFKNIDYSSITTNLDAFSCANNFENFTCLAVKQGSKDIILINIVNESVVNVPNSLQQNWVNSGSQYKTGISNSRTLGSTNFLFTICGQYASGISYCDITDITGTRVTTFNSNNYGFTVDGIYQQDAFISKLGNVFRIFVSEKIHTTAGSRVSYRIGTLDGTKLVDTSKSDTQEESISNFMVGDYDKDGSNEACIIVKNGTFAYNPTNATWLKCYDSDLSLQSDIDVTDVLNASENNFFGSVMADYNSSSSNLGIALYDGIYYQDGSDFVKSYNTGVSKSTSRVGRLITVFGNTDASPNAVYTDTATGFIFRNIASSVICGNDICENSENSLTCPEDCSIDAEGLLNNTGDPCFSNDDCKSGLCEYGFCVLKGSGVECNFDYQCLSGECKNNICTKPSYWARISASKTQQFGEDDNTNNFISLFFMILIPAFIIYHGNGSKGSISVGMGVFFMLAIFFAVVGWLSLFLMFGLFFIVLIMAVILLVLSGGSD